MVSADHRSWQMMEHDFDPSRGAGQEQRRSEFQDEPGLLHGDCCTLFSKNKQKLMTFILTILGKGNSS